MHDTELLVEPYPSQGRMLSSTGEINWKAGHCGTRTPAGQIRRANIVIFCYWWFLRQCNALVSSGSSTSMRLPKASELSRQ